MPYDILQCFSKQILIYLKYFVSLKSHSELTTHKDEPVTLLLNIFGNVMFNNINYNCSSTTSTDVYLHMYHRGQVMLL